MNQPCAIKFDCPCINSPFENLTSEAPDFIRYTRQFWRPTPENKLCHAPNRRVDIVVTGASR